MKLRELGKRPTTPLIILLSVLGAAIVAAIIGAICCYTKKKKEATKNKLQGAAVKEAHPTSKGKGSSAAGSPIPLKAGGSSKISTVTTADGKRRPRVKNEAPLTKADANDKTQSSSNEPSYVSRLMSWFMPGDPKISIDSTATSSSSARDVEKGLPSPKLKSNKKATSDKRKPSAKSSKDEAGKVVKKKAADGNSNEPTSPGDADKGIVARMAATVGLGSWLGSGSPTSKDVEAGQTASAKGEAEKPVAESSPSATASEVTKTKKSTEAAPIGNRAKAEDQLFLSKTKVLPSGPPPPLKRVKTADRLEQLMTESEIVDCKAAANETQPKAEDQFFLSKSKVLQSGPPPPLREVKTAENIESLMAESEPSNNKMFDRPDQDKPQPEEEFFLSKTKVLPTGPAPPLKRVRTAEKIESLMTESEIAASKSGVQADQQAKADNQFFLSKTKILPSGPPPPLRRVKTSEKIESLMTGSEVSENMVSPQLAEDIDADGVIKSGKTKRKKSKGEKSKSYEKLPNVDDETAKDLKDQFGVRLGTASTVADSAGSTASGTSADDATATTTAVGKGPETNIVGGWSETLSKQQKIGKPAASTSSPVRVETTPGATDEPSKPMKETSTKKIAAVAPIPIKIPSLSITKSPKGVAEKPVGGKIGSPSKANARSLSPNTKMPPKPAPKYSEESLQTIKVFSSNLCDNIFASVLAKPPKPGQLKLPKKKDENGDSTSEIILGASSGREADLLPELAATTDSYMDVDSSSSRTLSTPASPTKRRIRSANDIVTGSPQLKLPYKSPSHPKSKSDPTMLQQIPAISVQPPTPSVTTASQSSGNNSSNISKEGRLLETSVTTSQYDTYTLPSGFDSENSTPTSNTGGTSTAALSETGIGDPAPVVEWIKTEVGSKKSKGSSARNAKVSPVASDERTPDSSETSFPETKSVKSASTSKPSKKSSVTTAKLSDFGAESKTTSEPATETTKSHSYTKNSSRSSVTTAKLSDCESGEVTPATSEASMQPVTKSTNSDSKRSSVTTAKLSDGKMAPVESETSILRNAKSDASAISLSQRSSVTTLKLAGCITSEPTAADSETIISATNSNESESATEINQSKTQSYIAASLVGTVSGSQTSTEESSALDSGMKSGKKWSKTPSVTTASPSEAETSKTTPDDSINTTQKSTEPATSESDTKKTTNLRKWTPSLTTASLWKAGSGSSREGDSSEATPVESSVTTRPSVETITPEPDVKTAVKKTKIPKLTPKKARSLSATPHDDSTISIQGSVRTLPTDDSVKENRSDETLSKPTDSLSSLSLKKDVFTIPLQKESSQTTVAGTNNAQPKPDSTKSEPVSLRSGRTAYYTAMSSKCGLPGGSTAPEIFERVVGPRANEVPMSEKYGEEKKLDMTLTPSGTGLVPMASIGSSSAREQDSSCVGSPTMSSKPSTTPATPTITESITGFVVHNLPLYDADRIIPEETSDSDSPEQKLKKKPASYDSASIKPRTREDSVISESDPISAKSGRTLYHTAMSSKAKFHPGNTTPEMFEKVVGQTQPKSPDSNHEHVDVKLTPSGTTLVTTMPANLDPVPSETSPSASPSSSTPAILAKTESATGFAIYKFTKKKTREGSVENLSKRGTAEPNELKSSSDDEKPNKRDVTAMPTKPKLQTGPTAPEMFEKVVGLPHEVSPPESPSSETGQMDVSLTASGTTVITALPAKLDKKDSKIYPEITPKPSQPVILAKTESTTGYGIYKFGDSKSQTSLGTTQQGDSEEDVAATASENRKVVSPTSKHRSTGPEIFERVVGPPIFPALQREKVEAQLTHSGTTVVTMEPAEAEASETQASAAVSPKTSVPAALTKTESATGFTVHKFSDDQADGTSDSEAENIVNSTRRQDEQEPPSQSPGEVKSRAKIPETIRQQPSYQSEELGKPPEKAASTEGPWGLGKWAKTKTEGDDQAQEETPGAEADSATKGTDSAGILDAVSITHIPFDKHVAQRSPSGREPSDTNKKRRKVPFHDGAEMGITSENKKKPSTSSSSEQSNSPTGLVTKDSPMDLPSESVTHVPINRTNIRVCPEADEPIAETVEACRSDEVDTTQGSLDSTVASATSKDTKKLKSDSLKTASEPGGTAGDRPISTDETGESLDSSLASSATTKDARNSRSDSTKTASEAEEKCGTTDGEPTSSNDPDVATRTSFDSSQASDTTKDGRKSRSDSVKTATQAEGKCGTTDNEPTSTDDIVATARSCFDSSVANATTCGSKQSRSDSVKTASEAEGERGTADGEPTSTDDTGAATRPSVESSLASAMTKSSKKSRSDSVKTASEAESQSGTVDGEPTSTDDTGAATRASVESSLASAMTKSSKKSRSDSVKTASEAECQSGTVDGGPTSTDDIGATTRPSVESSLASAMTKSSKKSRSDSVKTASEAEGQSGTVDGEPTSTDDTGAATRASVESSLASAMTKSSKKSRSDSVKTASEAEGQSGTVDGDPTSTDDTGAATRPSVESSLASATTNSSKKSRSDSVKTASEAEGQTDTADGGPTSTDDTGATTQASLESSLSSATTKGSKKSRSDSVKTASEAEGQTDTADGGPTSTDDTGATTQASLESSLSSATTKGSKKSRSDSVKTASEAEGQTDTADGGPTSTDDTGATTQASLESSLSSATTKGSKKSRSDSVKTASEAEGQTDTADGGPTSTDDTGATTQASLESSLSSATTKGSKKSRSDSVKTASEAEGQTDTADGGQTSTDDTGATTQASLESSLSSATTKGSKKSRSDSVKTASEAESKCGTADAVPTSTDDTGATTQASLESSLSIATTKGSKKSRSDSLKTASEAKSKSNAGECGATPADDTHATSTTQASLASSLSTDGTKDSSMALAAESVSHIPIDKTNIRVCPKADEPSSSSTVASVIENKSPKVNSIPSSPNDTNAATQASIASSLSSPRQSKGPSSIATAMDMKGKSNKAKACPTIPEETDSFSQKTSSAAPSEKTQQTLSTNPSASSVTDNVVEQESEPGKSNTNSADNPESPSKSVVHASAPKLFEEIVGPPRNHRHDDDDDDDDVSKTSMAKLEQRPSDGSIVVSTVSTDAKDDGTKQDSTASMKQKLSSPVLMQTESAMGIPIHKQISDSSIEDYMFEMTGLSKSPRQLNASRTSTKSPTEDGTPTVDKGRDLEGAGQVSYKSDNTTEDEKSFAGDESIVERTESVTHIPVHKERADQCGNEEPTTNKSDPDLLRMDSTGTGSGPNQPKQLTQTESLTGIPVHVRRTESIVPFSSVTPKMSTDNITDVSKPQENQEPSADDAPHAAKLENEPIFERIYPYISCSTRLRLDEDLHKEREPSPCYPETEYQSYASSPSSASSAEPMFKPRSRSVPCFQIQDDEPDAQATKEIQEKESPEAKTTKVSSAPEQTRKSRAAAKRGVTTGADSQIQKKKKKPDEGREKKAKINARDEAASILKLPSEEGQKKDGSETSGKGEDKDKRYNKEDTDSGAGQSKFGMALAVSGPSGSTANASAVDTDSSGKDDSDLVSDVTTAASNVSRVKPWWRPKRKKDEPVPDEPDVADMSVEQRPSGSTLVTFTQPPVDKGQCGINKEDDNSDYEDGKTSRKRAKKILAQTQDPRFELVNIVKQTEGLRKRHRENVGSEVRKPSPRPPVPPGLNFYDQPGLNDTSANVGMQVKKKLSGTALVTFEPLDVSQSTSLADVRGGKINYGDVTVVEEADRLPATQKPSAESVVSTSDTIEQKLKKYHTYFDNRPSSNNMDVGGGAKIYYGDVTVYEEDPLLPATQKPSAESIVSTSEKMEHKAKKCHTDNDEKLLSLTPKPSSNNMGEDNMVHDAEPVRPDENVVKNNKFGQNIKKYDTDYDKKLLSQTPKPSSNNMRSSDMAPEPEPEKPEIDNVVKKGDKTEQKRKKYHTDFDNKPSSNNMGVGGGAKIYYGDVTVFEEDPLLPATQKPSAESIVSTSDKIEHKAKKYHTDNDEKLLSPTPKPSSNNMANNAEPEKPDVEYEDMTPPILKPSYSDVTNDTLSPDVHHEMSGKEYEEFLPPTQKPSYGNLTKYKQVQEAKPKCPEDEEWERLVATKKPTSRKAKSQSSPNSNKEPLSSSQTSSSNEIRKEQTALEINPGKPAEEEESLPPTQKSSPSNLTKGQMARKPSREVAKAMQATQKLSSEDIIVKKKSRQCQQTEPEQPLVDERLRPTQKRSPKHILLKTKDELTRKLYPEKYSVNDDIETLPPNQKPSSNDSLLAKQVSQNSKAEGTPVDGDKEVLEQTQNSSTATTQANGSEKTAEINISSPLSTPTTSSAQQSIGELIVGDVFNAQNEEVAVSIEQNAGGAKVTFIPTGIVDSKSDAGYSLKTASSLEVVGENMDADFPLAATQTDSDEAMGTQRSSPEFSEPLDEQPKPILTIVAPETSGSKTNEVIRREHGNPARSRPKDGLIRIPIRIHPSLKPTMQIPSSNEPTIGSSDKQTLVSSQGIVASSKMSSAPPTSNAPSTGSTNTDRYQQCGTRYIPIQMQSPSEASGQSIDINGQRLQLIEEEIHHDCIIREWSRCDGDQTTATKRQPPTTCATSSDSHDSISQQPGQSPSIGHRLAPKPRTSPDTRGVRGAKVIPKKWYRDKVKIKLKDNEVTVKSKHRRRSGGSSNYSEPMMDVVRVPKSVSRMAAAEGLGKLKAPEHWKWRQSTSSTSRDITNNRDNNAFPNNNDCN